MEGAPVREAGLARGQALSGKAWGTCCGVARGIFVWRQAGPLHHERDGMAYRAMREAVLSVEAGAQQHRVRGIADFYELNLMFVLFRNVDDRNILAVAVFLAVQRESAERHALGLPAGAGSEDVALSAVTDDR